MELRLGKQKGDGEGSSGRGEHGGRDVGDEVVFHAESSKGLKPRGVQCAADSFHFQCLANKTVWSAEIS